MIDWGRTFLAGFLLFGMLCSLLDLTLVILGAIWIIRGDDND